MRSAKLALIRCENLDLFAAPPSMPALPLMPESVAVSDQNGEPELLFRIGPDDQLDLFRHSPAEIATSATRRALKDIDPARARGQLALLRHLPAHAAFVADADRCVELIERHDERWADTARAVAWIETELWAAATRCLQRDAMLLLRPALLALLEQATARPFDPDCRQAHPGYLWQLLDQPAQALAALELDPLWREQPEALHWHAQLSELAHLPEHLQADVLELCLAWPDAAESFLSSSRSWASRWSDWCDLDLDLPQHAFPAWCRLTRAAEFPLDASDQRPGAQLLRSAQELAASPSDLRLRKAIHALCPGLLAAFLARRSAS